MKTLIFNGSPRKNGDTISLIHAMLKVLKGEVLVIDTYESSIKPCLDCRYCWENTGCIIDDEMQPIYDYIQACDNIVIASPIYFSELTGPLLSVTSRLQTYFCSRFFRKTEPIMKDKIGGVILVGGGDGSPEKAYDTASTILRHMNVKSISEPVCSHNTNQISASEDAGAIKKAVDLASFFNEKHHSEGQ